MARIARDRSRWPGRVDLGKLDPEERVNIMFEMSSAMGEIILDSIRDKYPKISESLLLNLTRRRIDQGRRHH